MLKILYFAWLKEKTGISEEDCALPKDVSDVQGLISWLQHRGGGFDEAFNDPSIVRVAVNQEHVDLDCELSDGDEVAFFPPVTGGR